MNTYPSNSKPLFNNQQSKSWLANLKYILDKSKQLIYVNKCEHPTGTLATTFLKPAGKQNRMSGLEISHRKVSITSENNDQVQ